MEISNNIIYRADLSNEYDDAQSIGHLIIENLTNAGDKIMLIDGITGEELSAIQIVNKSVEVARGLLAVGVKPGDVVSIVTENRFEFAFVLFGTLFINCTLAPLNNTYSERELNHAFSLSKPTIVFASASTSEKVLNVVNSLSHVRKVVLLDDDGPRGLNIVHLRDFTGPKALNGVHFEPKAVDKEKTICLIMCSSGTTGLPKGVQLSQANIIVTARNTKNTVASGSIVDDGDDVVILGLLPLFHAFGAAVLTCTMATASGRIVLLPKFEEATFLGCIQKYRCNILFTVPPLMVFLSKEKIVDSYDLSSLRSIHCGAAPLSKETEDAVRNRLNNSKLIINQGYGMSELTVGVLSQKNLFKPGSVGDVNSGNYAKVIDENGNALGPHQRGELCFKGTVLMIGYIGDAQATSAMIDKDGWLHSGDVGYYDEDLQFYIVDRIKELIKWKGYQVPPAGTLKFSIAIIS